MTAVRLRQRGHEAHLFPLARIERTAPGDLDLPPAERVDAVVLTSANAAFALARYSRLPVYAVGEATAEAARAAGAPQVLAAGGDWRSLTALIEGTHGPKSGARLLHLSGADVRGDLEGATAAAGFRYRRCVVYRVAATSWLDRPTVHLLQNRMLDAVLLFSPAHATIWRRVMHRADMLDRLFALRAVASSAAVAAAVADLPWRAVEVAAAPAVAAMLDRLEAFR